MRINTCVKIYYLLCQNVDKPVIFYCERTFYVIGPKLQQKKKVSLTSSFLDFVYFELMTAAKILQN